MSDGNNKVVTWGIIGCGDVTEVKSGPALSKASRSSVLRVMRRDGAKAADYAQRHGVSHWTDDADELINASDISAIYIATPPSTHADYAIRAMRAGKDVLVEKPMAMSVAECDAVTAVQAETGRKLCVAYYRRALPRFEKLREIVQQGDIGELRLIEVKQFTRLSATPEQSWKVDPQIGGGGFFADMQTHTLDWLFYTFGIPGATLGLHKRQSGAYAAEDLVNYLLDFKTFSAVGLCAYAVDEQEESVTLHGSLGSASMGFFGPSVITLTAKGETSEIKLPDPPHVHQPFIERVIQHFLDDGPNPCSAQDGRQVNVAMADIFKSTTGENIKT